MDATPTSSDDWIDHRHFSELDSTQTFVEREHASFDQSKLTVVSADYQTAGRGTKERSWHASGGKSALMTFFFQFPSACSTTFVNRNASNVTKVLAVAAVDALRETAGDSLECGIKWPNDVVVGRGKIAGILARAEPSPGTRLDRIIVGIGVNVNTSQADLDLIDRPVWPAISLRAAAGDKEDFDLALFRQRLISAFALELRSFFDGGFPLFQTRLNNLEVLMGTQVCFRVHEEQVVEAVFQGVDDEGLIMLRLPSGETKSYPSGEIIPRPA